MKIFSSHLPGFHAMMNPHNPERNLLFINHDSLLKLIYLLLHGVESFRGNRFAETKKKEIKESKIVKFNARCGITFTTYKKAIILPGEISKNENLNGSLESLKYYTNAPASKILI